MIHCRDSSKKNKLFPFFFFFKQSGRINLVDYYIITQLNSQSWKKDENHSFYFPLEFCVAVIVDVLAEQNWGGAKKPGANLVPFCGSDPHVQRTRNCCSLGLPPA